MGDSGGSSSSSGSSGTRRTPKLNDFIRNITEPDKLAAEMGTQEVMDKVPQKDRRFEIRDGNWITKPYEDTRSQKDKDKDDRADARAAKEREKAASAVETVEDEEEEEETTTPATAVDTAQETVTQLADTTVSAEAANRPRSQAETEAAADQTAGYKSGTIATSPSGVSNEDTSGLRPKKSAMARTGLLADDDDPKKKKTLIA